MIYKKCNYAKVMNGYYYIMVYRNFMHQISQLQQVFLKSIYFKLQNEICCGLVALEVIKHPLNGSFLDLVTQLTGQDKSLEGHTFILVSLSAGGTSVGVKRAPKLLFRILKYII